LSEVIRYGMVGGGNGAFIGEVHRQSARLSGQFQLVCGAFSSQADESLQWGLALGLSSERCYPDFQTMIEAENRLPTNQRMQCVVIVTPNHLHLPVARAAIKAGLHVISDKPATINLQECRELAELLADNKSLYALTHPYTAYPMIKEARDRVARGELGEVRKVIVEYMQGWLANRVEGEGHKQASWRTDPNRAGISCCIGDIGVHAFNIAEYVSGLETVSLSAELNRIVPGRQLDDDGTALLKFKNGASGILIASQICSGEENNLRLRIYGERGGLDWRQEEPNSLWLKFNDQSAQLLRAGTAWLGDSAKGNTRLPAGHPEGYLEAFANIYRNFAEHLNNNSNNKNPESDAFPGIREALRGMAFIETSVFSSEQNNAWLEFPKLL
jgi:predicted dehydrogenase